jgi:hypothetical protein
MPMLGCCWNNVKWLVSLQIQQEFVAAVKAAEHPSDGAKSFRNDLWAGVKRLRDGCAASNHVACTEANAGKTPNGGTLVKGILPGSDVNLGTPDRSDDGDDILDAVCTATNQVANVLVQNKVCRMEHW